MTTTGEHATTGSNEHTATDFNEDDVVETGEGAVIVLNEGAGIETDADATIETGEDVVTETSEPATITVDGMLSPEIGALEALLLVAGEAATIEALGRALGAGPVEIEAMLSTLDGHYQHTGHGVRVLRHGPRAQLATEAAHAGMVARFLGVPEKAKLSPAALETLAIVAYRQPVSRPEVEAVRGVNSDHIMRSLLDAGLLEEQGQADTPGRAALYGTSAGFLETLGFSSLADLPPLDDEPR